MIILASASPRRAELLKLITKDFKIIPSNIDENVSMTDPKELVLELSKLKAMSVYSKNSEATVIGADTIVEMKGKIFGKPRNAKEAENMLFVLSGNAHFVHTGMCIVNKEKTICDISTTKVYFDHITNSEIKRYLEEEDYLDKAGAYAIQEGAAKYINKIEGCFFNVMGLPVSKLYAIMQMLQKIY